MIVRVYDRTTDSYFKSEVFANINSGWYEKQLVIVPFTDGAYIKIFGYLEKGGEEEAPNVLINVIILEIPEDWISRNTYSVDKQLTGFEEFIEKDVFFFEYIGYSWIFDDKRILAELLNGGEIPLKKASLKIGSVILEYQDGIMSRHKMMRTFC